MRGQTKPLPGAQIDWGHPLAQGLVGCWLMNEGAGQGFADLVGATLASGTGVRWAGNVATFVGTQQVITTSNNNSVKGFPSASVCAIVTPSKVDVAQRIYSEYLASTTASSRFTLRVLTNNTVDLGGRAPDTDSFAVWVVSNRTITLGQKNSIVAVYSPTTAHAIGINGVVKTASVSDLPFDNTDPASPPVIGAFLVSSEVWNGAIESVQIYRRALTITEMLSIHAEPYAFIRTPTYRKYFIAGRGR